MENNFITENFNVLKKLGNETKRKFSQLFLVEDLITHEKFTVKIIKKAGTPNFVLDAFIQESKFKFKSSYLPQNIAFHDIENELVLVKKYVNGLNLDVYWRTLKKNEQLGFIIKFLKKIQESFDELREIGLVHNDIKPSNILIETKKDDFEVHLIDFSLSFFPKQTIERGTLFSLGFSAPEIILKKFNLANHSSDLFSLGICLYYLFSCSLPGTHANPAIMTNLQLTYPIQEHKSIPHQFFPILEKMCAKGTFKKPANLLSDSEVKQILDYGISMRYQSIQEIIQDMEKIDLSPKSWWQKIIP